MKFAANVLNEYDSKFIAFPDRINWIVYMNLVVYFFFVQN